MNERIYVGVPSQEEIKTQYNEIVGMTKEVSTIEQLLKFKELNKGIEIEVNHNNINEYNNDPIEVIRYGYKNILVYANIKDGKTQYNDYVTLFNDEGDIQFADALYYNYNEEIERVAKMGLLERVMTYDERCQLVAGKWEHKFNNNMEKEDHEEFQKDLEIFNVDRFHVYNQMNDCGNI